MNAPRSGYPINLTLEALGGSLEPDRHPRPDVRQPPSLPRVADPVGGADSLEHSDRPADAPGETRIGIPSRRSQPGSPRARRARPLAGSNSRECLPDDAAG